HTDCGRTARAELGVHPGDDPRRCHVRRVGDVHAARGPGDDGARTGHFDKAAHHRRRFTTLTGAMAGCIEFLQGNVVDTFDLLVSDRFCGSHRGFLSWLLADSDPRHLSVPGRVARGLLGEVEHPDA